MLSELKFRNSTPPSRHRAMSSVSSGAVRNVSSNVCSTGDGVSSGNSSSEDKGSIGGMSGIGVAAREGGLVGGRLGGRPTLLSQCRTLSISRWICAGVRDDSSYTFPGLMAGLLSRVLLLGSCGAGGSRGAAGGSERLLPEGAFPLPEGASEGPSSFLSDLFFGGAEG